MKGKSKRSLPRAQTTHLASFGPVFVHLVFQVLMVVVLVIAIIIVVVLYHGVWLMSWWVTMTV